MASDTLLVSAVICAYTLERWSDLQQAIRSVQQQTHPPDELILVIDHNPQLLTLAKQTFSGVNVVENQHARGLSGARNSGISHTHGRVIAFMDEDAVAAPDWIERLLSGYHDPNVVGVGGAVRPDWVVTPPNWLPDEFGWVVGCSYKGLPEIPTPMRNPIGCNMSFLRDALTASGGFRSGMGRVGRIPLGCEETELSIRITHLNPSSVILYQPESVVFHKVPEWRTRWDYFIHRCYAEGLSKALVTQYVGSIDGLSSERRYITRTLAQGVFYNLKTAVLHKKPIVVTRSAAIVLGLGVTTLGYLVGTGTRLIQHKGSSQPRLEQLSQTFLLLNPQRIAHNEDHKLQESKRD